MNTKNQIAQFGFAGRTKHRSFFNRKRSSVEGDLRRMVSSPRWLSPQRTTGKAAGFTLIEVTMAIGIASFAILSMLGGMVVGMKTLRGAIDTTVQAQITQDLVASLKQANFSTVSGGANWNRTYDDRGVALPNNASGGVYSASVVVSNATLSGGSVNPNLVKVVVGITNIADPGNPYTFSTFVSNNGQ